jgi:heme/copper-type cytochrome/quinol oxidase subunit 2
LARRPRTRLLSALAALCSLALAAPARAGAFGLEEAHSPNAEGISTAYWVMITVTVIALVAINAALIVAVLRFRDRRGREPARFSAGRGALTPVAAALSLAAIAIFVFGVVVTSDVREIEPTGASGLSAVQTAQVGIKGAPAISLFEEDPASGEGQDAGAEPAPLEINATAQQWLWRFEYPGGQPGNRTFSYGELVVPVDTAVILNVTSIDVLHSWWVPALGGQVQATPGEVSKTWFKADEVGRYEGRSTIFSGSGFPAMRTWVRVVEAPEYEEYVSTLQSDLAEAQRSVQEAAAEEDAG